MNSRQLAQEWPFPRHITFKQHLQRAAATWFKSKQLATDPKMPYCLAKWSDWGQNIMLSEVRDYILDCKRECELSAKPFPIHKYVHHGLSSQAMIFNLIGPQITRKDCSSTTELLQDKGLAAASQIASAHFEYEDREVFNEDAGQPTSVDVVFNDSAGKPIVFMEGKLVEPEFGGCSVFSNGDCEGRNPIGRENGCYLHFIKRKYWDLMHQFGLTALVSGERQCIFLAHYQFFREVLLSLVKGASFVLLSDARSPVFHCSANGEQRGIMPLLMECIPIQHRGKIISISIQELVGKLKANRNHVDWIEEFEIKYGLA